MAADADALFMARALSLARHGLYSTDPNPRVGCVLVKHGQIIGEGWHQRAGGPHAETAALACAPNPRGATAYVTLEPCSHHGKTPPCADALVAAGISRVVAAMEDPNPLVSGRGLARLRAAGVSVSVGVLAGQARALNPGFILRMTQNRPLVRSKLAMSVDGRTACATGASQWITGPKARQDVHRLRAASSAILTGMGTVLADDPALTARVDFPHRPPARVVLDSRLRTPATARLIRQPGRSLVLTCASDGHRQQALEQAGAEVHRLEAAADGRLALPAVMAFLAAQQFNEVFVEAGAALNGALMAHKLVDELIIYMAPCLLGDGGRALLHLPNLLTMADKVLLRLVDVRQVGTDLRLTLRPSTDQAPPLG